MCVRSVACDLLKPCSRYRNTLLAFDVLVQSVIRIFILYIEFCSKTDLQRVLTNVFVVVAVHKVREI